jgi:hypothetical protein
MAEVTKAELLTQLTDMTKRATDAETRAENLSKQLEEANERAGRLAASFAEQGKEIDGLNAEVRSLTGSLKAYKGSATKARTEVAILKREQSPEARPIGAMKPAKSEEQAAARAEALAAAFACDTTELVFSDGRREIRELAPRIITGDAWRDTPSGRVLNSVVDLEPGDCQRETMELRGFALLNEAGEQVDYCPLPDAIVIGRNQHFQLPLNTIRF